MWQGFHETECVFRAQARMTAPPHFLCEAWKCLPVGFPTLHPCGFQILIFFKKNCGKIYINIKFTILTIFKCTYSSMVLSTFTLLCNHHHHPSLECKTEIPCLSYYSPQQLAATILLSVSLNLPIRGTSCKWNHTVFVLS